jgi:hypothetical protein
VDDLIPVLSQLHASEISFLIDSFWDRVAAADHAARHLAKR